LQEKITKLKEQMKELQAIEVKLEASPDKQVSLTDPDAHSMMSGGKGIVGYNVQTAVVADKGDFKSEEILACHQAGITAYVPKAMTSGAKFDGRFNNDAVLYDSTRDVYICPAKEVLTWRSSYVEKGMTLPP